MTNSVSDLFVNQIVVVSHARRSAAWTRNASRFGGGSTQGVFGKRRRK